MQGVRYKSSIKLACFLPVIIGLLVNTVSAQSKPQVPEDYQKFFVHYVDNRSISEKALNLVKLSLNDVGRSFALISGVSRYPNMSLTNQELRPASEDIIKLQHYLTTYEFFDEVVVLQDGNVTTENLEFFLQTYFPGRLAEFPKSRFLFAYSGHGMTEGSSGYLLKNTAQSLTDKTNSINLGVVRVFVDEVVKKGHHVLVLLNACYSGAFLRRSFGDSMRLIPRYPGAHAITAGGTGEQTWHIPAVGKGSVFFEKVFAGLDGRADSSGDGLIGVYELFSYLKQEVQIFTNQDQNPQVGDLTIHGSKGEFFFLNRDLQVSRGVSPEWKPETATPFGIKADELLITGKEYYNKNEYRTALPYFRESARQGNSQAMGYIAWMYEKGLGVTTNYAEALRWYRQAADTGDTYGMHGLAQMYRVGLGVPTDYAEALFWYRKAADAGDVWAMSGLAWMYREGRGVATDYAEALRWYRMSADGGHAAAMGTLGYMYREGLGVPADYAEALYWSRKAADAGDAYGMVETATIYREGLGVPKDYAQALYWYRKAADAGNASAMNWIGWMYENGLGVTTNYAEALRWYRKAADAGNEYAIKRLKNLGGQ